jgi:hypothetical protein
MEPSRAAGPKHACKIAPRRGLIPTPLVGTPNSLAVAPPGCDGHFFWHVNWFTDSAGAFALFSAEFTSPA